MACLKLHGSVMSTATMRAIVCLKEKELEFEFVPVNMATGDHKKEPYISLNVSHNTTLSVHLTRVYFVEIESIGL